MQINKKKMTQNTNNTLKKWKIQNKLTGITNFAIYRILPFLNILLIFFIFDHILLRFLQFYGSMYKNYLQLQSGSEPVRYFLVWITSVPNWNQNFAFIFSFLVFSIKDYFENGSILIQLISTFWEKVGDKTCVKKGTSK